MNVYDKHKVNLVPVKEQDWWKIFEGDLINGVPEIPVYHPGREADEWKYASGLKEGYKLALQHLGVKP